MKFRSRLVVNLHNLHHNYSVIKKMAPETEVLFMVKADGYGHGMIPIARYAMTELGIKEFGCATISEALKLREELNDLEFDIYVFSDIQLELFENADIYLKRRIIPVISNVSELEYILHTPEFKNFPICMKFNTGMNRLGLDPNDAPRIVSMLKNHGRTSVHHLISHYANASYPMDTNERNVFQRTRFLEIKKLFTDSGIILERTSQSNSGAIEQNIGFKEHGDTHIRPGLMMYGPTSLLSEYTNRGYFKGKVVSSLETYIIRTFEVKAGTPIGYGSTICPHDGVVAVLAIGYGDGFSTRYGGAHLYHKGFEGVITGRVNMDMIQVLFPIEARDHILAHEIFTIWGKQDGDLLKFSEETKTIPYELFCSLLPRVPRVYRLD
ncbi:MAG: alanine racemase [Bacteriovorax sp.]|nr:alanine racemase [Bacteriovorax sp.]